MLDCNPSLSDIKELIHELNKTNGLFKLVRIMRRRFQEAAAEGVPWVFNFSLERYFSTKRLYVCYSTGAGAPALSLHQGSSVISTSAPVLSSSTEGSESSTEEINIDEVEETNKHSKNILPRKTPAIHSSGSAFSLRRSPRFKVCSILMFDVCWYWFRILGYVILRGYYKSISSMYNRLIFFLKHISNCYAKENY